MFKKTYKVEGLKGFYRGYVPTILGIIPYAGTSFFTYGTLKTFIRGKSRNIVSYISLLFVILIAENHGYENMAVNLACGAVAGMMGQSSSYPLDIVRRKMQTSIITGENFISLRKTFIIIYR